MSFFTCLMHFIIYTTILSDVKLCIVQSRLLLDLLFNECKCVHCSLLKEWKVNLLSFRWIRFPVPSVVCVPDGMNDPFRDLLASLERDERGFIITPMNYICKYMYQQLQNVQDDTLTIFKVSLNTLYAENNHLFQPVLYMNQQSLHNTYNLCHQSL